ncbi:13730_t:CDS:2, partial [Acaulospora colombiana]
QQDSQRARAVLFIVDRTVDMYVPVLHEFTYQAMANDLLPIEDGNKYTYNYAGDDGEQATKEAILDEADSIWVDIRHKHMKDCIDQLMKDFNEFLVQNTGFTDKEKAANLNDMKKMLATLPQFQNMKEKVNCATGYTPDSQHPKTLVEDMVPMLDNPVVRLKLVVESHISKTIDHTHYPYTKDPTGDPDGSKSTQQGPKFIEDLSLLLKPPTMEQKPALPARPEVQSNSKSPKPPTSSSSGGYVPQMQGGYSQQAGYNQQGGDYAQYSRQNAGYPQSMPASSQQYINVPRPSSSNTTQSEKTKSKSSIFKF